jgi:hypothetical protein
MINHVRTLLQNRSHKHPSDEFVPEDFVAMRCPAVVQKIKRVLWGRTPVSQLRIRQIMQILHTTELEEHVLAPDSRITYLPFDDKYFDKSDVDLTVFIPELTTTLTPDDDIELFDDISIEPNRTFYELWKRHDQVPYKLGGLMLAVVAATERAR